MSPEIMVSADAGQYLSHAFQYDAPKGCWVNWITGSEWDNPHPDCYWSDWWNSYIIPRGWNVAGAR